MRLVVSIVFLLIIGHGESTVYQCNSRSSCGCSSPSTVLTRIIGGESAVHGSWLWAASLRIYGHHLCGASIISSLYLVTAAHCFTDIHSLSDVTILAGSSTLIPSVTNTFYQIRSITRVYIHPNYNEVLYNNDIAILRLSRPLNMTDGSVKSICLPNGTVVRPPDKTDLVAVGWGVTSMGQQTAAPALRQVTVQSIAATASDCLSVISNKTVQFCAGTGGGKDTCQGDSGGPLMAFVGGLWELDGITSNGYGCALAGYAGIYTRVSQFIPWINSIVTTGAVSTTTSTTSKKPTTTTTTKSLKTSSKGTTSTRKVIKDGYNGSETNIAEEVLDAASSSIRHFSMQSMFLTLLFLTFVGSRFIFYSNPSVTNFVL